MIWRVAITIALLSSVCPSALADAGVESAQRISATASQFIAKRHPWQNENTRITVGELDPRTRLAKCSQRLRAFLPPGASIRRRTTVGVRCEGVKAWKVYLPVTIAAFTKVMVSKHPIAAGQRLTEADITWTERDVSSLSYGYQKGLGSEGMLSRRSIPQGAVITANMLEAPAMIKKGQELKLISHSTAINVSMKGRALQDAAKGARIRVENISSGKQLEGIVISGNTVRIE